MVPFVFYAPVLVKEESPGNNQRTVRSVVRSFAQSHRLLAQVIRSRFVPHALTSLAPFLISMRSLASPFGGASWCAQILYKQASSVTFESWKISRHRNDKHKIATYEFRITNYILFLTFIVPHGWEFYQQSKFESFLETNITNVTNVTKFPLH